MPESILEELLQARNEITVTFPGKRGKSQAEGGFGKDGPVRVTLWELGADELADAEMDALKYLAKKGEMERGDVRALYTPQAIDVETKVQTLFRAMRDPDDARVSFARYDNVVRRMATYDIHWLYDRLLEHQAACSQYLSIEIEALKAKVLEALGKGPTPAEWWQRLDGVTARILGFTLEERASLLTLRVQDLERQVETLEQALERAATGSSPATS